MGSEKVHEGEPMDYQLLPLHIHLTNLAERAIQKIKSHLMIGLASLDPDFTFSKRDRLIPQVELTLNLLRAARSNPNLSAWAYLFGKLNYMASPVVPPGIKALAHDKQANIFTWAMNRQEGWTIGPSLEHYRCIKCFLQSTRSVRNVVTVTFFPRDIPIPKVGLDAFLRQVATDIITILIAPPSTTTLSLEAGDSTRNALQKIAETLNRVDILLNPPTPSPRVETSTKFHMTVPRATSTDNATLPRVQEYSTSDKPTTSPIPTPTPIINYKEKWKREIQRINQIF